MVTTKFVLDMEGIKEMVNEINYINRTLINPRKINKEMSVFILSKVEEGFENMMDPFGRKWEHLKRPRSDGSNKPLTDTGKLRKSFRAKIDDKRIEIGSSVFYASFHQFGVPEQNLVDRQILPNNLIPASWELELEEIAIKHLLGYSKKI